MNAAGSSPVPVRDSTRAMAARRVSRRAAAIGSSVTLAIDARAKELRAAGRPVVIFGAGEPDFPTPAHIVEAAAAACHDPRMHKYTSPAGLPELRAAVAAVTSRTAGYDIAPGQVVISNGGKQAIANAFTALLDPGDEVLVPAPYWTSYPEIVRLADGVPVPVFAGADVGYKVTVDDLEAARTPATRALVFVSPNNPTGAVYTAAETQAIGEWAATNGLWVVTDEIYEHLRYGPAAGGAYPSLPALVPELADRCVIVNGVAKTYAMTGWRVGWLVAPLDVAQAAADLMSHTSSNVANVSQAAALAALTGPQDEVGRMRDVFDARRQRMLAMLRAIPGVECPEPLGAFYCFPSVTRLLGRAVRGEIVTSSAELAELVLAQAEVALVPGEAFGAPGHLRLSYALGDADLVEGLTRLQALLGDVGAP